MSSPIWDLDYLSKMGQRLTLWEHLRVALYRIGGRREKPGGADGH